MDSNAVILPSHPLSVKPAGNLYTTNENAKEAAGLFSILPDEIIIKILELLSKKVLLRLGATCKALYAFTALDELWKPLFIGYVSVVLTAFRKF